MGFKYPIRIHAKKRKHAKKGMMMQTFQSRNLKMTTCLMNCSKGRKHARVRGDKRLHVTMKCCWKQKVLFSTHTKTSKRKGQ